MSNLNDLAMNEMEQTGASFANDSSLTLENNAPVHKTGKSTVQRPALQEAVESSPCKTCLSEGEKQNPSHKYLFPAKTLPVLVEQWEGQIANNTLVPTSDFHVSWQSHVACMRAGISASGFR